MTRKRNPLPVRRVTYTFRDWMQLWTPRAHHARATQRKMMRVADRITPLTLSGDVTQRIVFLVGPRVITIGSLRQLGTFT